MKGGAKTVLARPPSLHLYAYFYLLTTINYLDNNYNYYCHTQEAVHGKETPAIKDVPPDLAHNRGLKDHCKTHF